VNLVFCVVFFVEHCFWCFLLTIVYLCSNDDLLLLF